MTNEEAIKKLKAVQAEFNENWVDYGGINEAFEKAYQALEEKPQGKWIIGYTAKQKKVAVCNLCNCISVQGKTNFCPNCGADMRKGNAEQ